MSNPTNRYVTPVGLQQPAAADLSDGTTGSGAVVQAASPTLTGSPLVPTPTTGDNSTKIASTAFVTTAITNAVAGINPAVAVQAATAAILPNSPTYLNGVAGIGATITAGVTNTTLVVDGYTPSLNDRILVKNESGGGGLGAGKNGVYFVSQLAALGLAWVLTRALDYDQPSDINSTGAIPVINGTVNTTTQWVLTSSITAVDGTQALTYAQFSANPSTLAPLASPAFTGTPTAPTAALATNTTQLATTAFVIANAGSGAVSSVFARTGAVVAVANDYWLVQKRNTHISADGSTTTPQAVGDVCTNTGSSGTISQAATTVTGYGIGTFQNSVSSPNGWAGNTIYNVGRNISFFWQGFSTRLTTQRFWVGMTDQTLATMGVSDNPAGNYAAFRYSSTGSDTVWQCITKDNTTQTIVSSGVAPVLNTTQTLAIVFNDSIPNVVFYINGAVVATITTHLPTSGTNLRYVSAQAWTVNSTNSELFLSHIRISSDF